MCIVSVAFELLFHPRILVGGLAAVGIPILGADYMLTAARLLLKRVRVSAGVLEIRDWVGRTHTVSLDVVDAIVFCSVRSQGRTPRPFVGVIGSDGRTLLRIEPTFLSETRLRELLSGAGALHVRGTFEDVYDAPALEKIYPGLPDWMALNPGAYGLALAGLIVAVGLTVAAMFHLTTTSP